MNKRLLLLFLFVITVQVNSLFAQTFSGAVGAIPDTDVQTCFPVTVTGLPATLTAANGLTQVCLNISHAYVSDIDVWLVSPNGGSILLTSFNGGAGDNYATTCFTATAGTSITAGAAPFNGTYQPEGSWGCVNNGTNGNGTWYLCIRDYYAFDGGTLNSWSITFGGGATVGTAPGCGTSNLANDVCQSATPICSLNGFCGNTSNCYSPGQVPAGFCGSVENNSWLSFVASATSATLNITVSNCFWGDGIQMEVYGTTNCATFTSYSTCWSPGVMTNGSITATGLTIGQTYYLMIDGFAGDNCDYSISASSGVFTVNVSASAATICQGSSTTLTANATGATGYLWAPGGATTSSITVSPATTTTYTVTISGACGASTTATSTVVVNTPATVDAGGPQTICSNTTATMSGSFGGGASSATWSTSGSGSFSSGTATNAVYTPSAADITAGSVTITYTTNDPAGPCPAVNASMVLTINPVAVVGAGADQPICAGSTATLGGNMSGGATSITWTTSGTGSFSNSSILNPVYTPSAADISLGSVTLTITSNDPSGPCNAVTDFMILSINTPAATNAGPPVASICAGSTYTTAGSSVSGGATTSLWTTSGSGTFASATTPVTVYTPSAADIASGTVTLTITTNDPTGPCGPATDLLTLTINQAATATAGSPQMICGNGTVTLTGSIGGSATSSTWTTSGTGTFANASLVNTTYTPSAADIAATSVTLTLTTNDPAGICPAVTSTVLITINPAATANAGPATDAICAGSTYTLAGSVGGGATTLTWTTSGSGSFSSSTSGSAVYTPSASDITAGSVTITITSNDPSGPCVPATDNLVLSINPGAIVSAGPTPVAICSGTTYSIPGSTGGSTTSVSWTTSGTGSFSSTTAVSPIYTPSAADITAGSVTLTVTTNDPAGPCPAATSNMVLNINPAAIVNAGPVSATICANQTYTLTGTSGGSTGSVAWTTSGSGTFSSTSILTPVYTPSASDIASGTITLTITSNDPAGPCGPVSDPITLNITPLQSAAFTYGSATYCQTGTNPTPSVTGVAGGTFSFSPAGLSINATTGAINLAASTLGTYTVTYTTPGPCANSSNVSVTITLAPTATFSYAGPYCTSGADPFPTFSGGATGGTFSSTAGLVFVNVNTGQIDVSASTPGTYTVTNTIVASGGCAAASANNTVTINAAATANAGTPITICAGSTVPVAGAIGGGATTLTWTTSGTGTFAAATSASTVYTPSAADVTAGTITLTLTTNDPGGPCPAVTSTVLVTINPAAVVTTAATGSICAGSTFPLAGGSGGSTTSTTWTTSGTGTFNNAALLNAIYTPSAADITAGSVILTITSNDPSGPCNAATATLTLTINPLPTVSTGANPAICAGSTFPYAGSMGGGASSVTWTTSGTGTFSNATSLSGTYTPSAADITAGSVTLTITSNDPAGPCNAVSASMIITINPAAVVTSGGPTGLVCAGSAFPLNGTMTGGASSITWTTSGTGTFNNAALLNAIYTPSAADITAGSVVLTITSNDPAGPCPAVSATLTLTISPLPVVTTGANTPICSGSTFPYNGTMSGGASSITWTTSGTGTFSNATSVSGTYTPSAADIAAGSVVLTITSNDPAGPCTAVSATMTITISPAATVFAGGPNSICAGSTFPVTGATMGGGATSVTWTTSGTGTFSNPNILAPIYTPSAADITAATVTLTITTNDPAGPCGAVTNSMVLSINPPATVTAGGNNTICSGSTYSLVGTMGGSATSITWTTSGSGTFSSATSPTAVYTPSAADISAGSVTLTITSNNPAGPCNAVSDVMTLFINPAATVGAGADQTICSNLTANLTGVFGGSASGVTWTSSGSGIFGSTTSASTTYSPSAADITAGSVTLTITTNDPAGVCNAVTDNLVLTINQQDNATFSYPSSTFCQTGTDPTATVVGGASGTFVATPAGLVFLNATTGLIDVSASALGNYFITFNTSGICPNNSTINVTVTAAPDATMSYGTPFCQSGTASPTYGPGASAGVYSASPAGLVFISTATGQVDLTASAPGTYTITNTIAAASGCAAASSSTTIVIDPVATVSAGVDGTICEGSAYPLAGTMGGSSTSVTWTSSGTGVFSNASSLTSTYTPSAADVAAGFVTLTVTTNDPAGVCTQATDVVTLMITPLDVATFNYTGSTFCQTGTNPTPGVTGLPGGTFSSTPAGLVFVSTATGEINLSGSTLGTYNIIYSTAGACPNTDTVSITITNAPSANFSYATPFCATATNPIPNFPVGSSGGVFSATPGGLVFVSTATGEVDLAGSIPGTYTITNSIAAGGGCAAASATTTIVIDQAPTVDAGTSGVICAGSSYLIPGATIGGSATGSVWSGSGSGTFDNSALLGATYTPSAADTAAGTVTLYLTTNDPAGACASVIDSISITINNTPNAPLATNPPAACFGSPVAPITASGTGGTFTWYSNAGLTVIASTGNPFSPASTATTSFWVTETIGVCQGPATMVTVTINPLPTADTSLVTVTSADCGTLTGAITGVTVTSGVAPFTYSWVDSTGSVIDTVLNLTGVGPGNYVLTITDSNGCSVTLGGASGYNVNSSSSVVASFTSDSLSGQTPLTVTFTNTSTGASNYFWTFGTGDTTSTFSPVYTYIPLGQFPVCLIASNAAGCADTACSTIDVFINSVFVIPNIFTPNGDDNNDVFTVKAVGLETMDAEVFNRWGQKEYEWHTTNGGWDGRTASGVEAPDGTYFFMMKAKGFDGKEYFEKGYFQLVR